MGADAAGAIALRVGALRLGADRPLAAPARRARRRRESPGRRRRADAATGPFEGDECPNVEDLHVPRRRGFEARRRASRPRGERARKSPCAPRRSSRASAPSASTGTRGRSRTRRARPRASSRSRSTTATWTTPCGARTSACRGSRAGTASRRSTARDHLAATVVGVNSRDGVYRLKFDDDDVLPRAPRTRSACSTPTTALRRRRAATRARVGAEAAARRAPRRGAAGRARRRPRGPRRPPAAPRRGRARWRTPSRPFRATAARTRAPDPHAPPARERAGRRLETRLAPRRPPRSPTSLPRRATRSG